MADESKPQLTEEEKIEKKAKLFRLISRILIVIAVIVIGVFIYYAMGTKQNIATQTSLDTQELRSKLKQIVSLEIRYHQQNGEYAGFKYLQLCRELPQYNPAVDGSFKYKFDPETGIATGQEKDATNDVNGDIDGNDGLTLNVNWEADIQEGSSGGNFFWTDEDIASFEKRKAQTQ
ncbi:hypothetical protein ACFL5B_02300 [Candidatus Latescibacterota bacterium]